MDAKDDCVSLHDPSLPMLHQIAHAHVELHRAVPDIVLEQLNQQERLSQQHLAHASIGESTFQSSRGLTFIVKCGQAGASIPLMDEVRSIHCKRSSRPSDHLRVVKPVPAGCLRICAEVGMWVQKALEGALIFALNSGKQVILLTPLPVDVLGDLEATLRSRPNLPALPTGFLVVNQMPAARPT